MLQRLLSPLVEVRREEALTAVMMFAYSFLAMAAYNILKPITRSKFIGDLGPDNLPYVLLAAGILIGILMTGYSWLMARLPERGGLPITQAGMAAVLFGFWVLFQTGATWVSVAFYLMALLLGVLLISQFWTLPIFSTIRGRRRGSSGSSAAGRRSAALLAPRCSRATRRRSARRTCC